MCVCVYVCSNKILIFNTSKTNMPGKKKKGGKKNKKNKNAPNRVRELLYKGDSQEYGLVLRLLGDRRADVHCSDGKRRLCKIRGSMKGRMNRVHVKDFVIVCLRDYQDNKGDISHKFQDDEVKRLKKQGEIPEFLLNTTLTNLENNLKTDDLQSNEAASMGDNKGKEEDIGFEFGEESDNDLDIEFI